MKDYYAILGVNKQATDSEIKKAYRKLAGQHHPDRGGDADAFKKIQEAYDVLGNASKRKEYDNPEGFFTQRNNFDDILDQYFTQFDRVYFRDSRINLWINLEDVARGGPRLITVNTGASSMPIEINVPQGVQDGEAIRYPKLIRGTDLVVGFRINPHPKWHREGLDLWCEKQLNFWECIGGTSIEIKDILGNTVTLKIPPRTKPGSSLRLKGKGLQREKYNTGDMFVKVRATMPDEIPDEIVEVLNKIVHNK